MCVWRRGISVFALHRERLRFIGHPNANMELSVKYTSLELLGSKEVNLMRYQRVLVFKGMGLSEVS